MLTNWTSGPSLPAISPTWGTGVAPSDDCLLSSTPWHWSFQHRPARSTLARPALSHGQRLRLIQKMRDADRAADAALRPVDPFPSHCH